MKFGKVLQQSTQMSPSAWEPYWADYKLLKKIIKDCAQIKKEEKLQGDKLVKIKIKPSAKEDNDSIRQSQDEMNFFRTLRMEIKKIADFFIKEQAKHTSQVAAIDASFQELKTNPESAEAKTALMKSCVALYKELLLLENFAVMNFCGISKILKKHDKWTGYATRNKFMHTILMKQPFATYEPLLQMIDRLEHIFMQATGSSIEQHDAQKSSSRRSDGGGSSSSSPSGEAPGSSGPASGGASGKDASTSNNNSSSNSPSHTPPGANGRRHDGRRYRSTVDEASPRSEDSVTLVRVNALRDDVRELRKIESAYDGDGEYEENVDDTTFPDDDAEVPPLRFGGRPQEEKAILPPLPLRVPPAGTQSDSDAAAMAMLSMKDAALRASGVSSDGGDSAAESCRTRSAKRKACAPLDMEGKRKMSVTAILN
ncbi:SPX domain-containing protein 1 [Phytophthora cinnamomi]|uniref:SPX domain-containing protein 1 n=1 Tax=Phytophthora cinnamomi TaxID=4785 RepID=UPI00355A4167|nr:SPX domain-containing protein 1 [Phytophthora cinnamomi]KAG6619249.1 SPX domain-containing protein 1 [Phytophthora cinnamomi]